MGSLTQHLTLVLAVIAWYAASAVANTSSRKILNHVPSPILLTFLQFSFSSFFLSFYFFFLKPNSSHPYSTRYLLKSLKQLCSQHIRYLKVSEQNDSPKVDPLIDLNQRRISTLLLRLGFFYTLGFIFVNAGYVVVTVSLAETLRSAEPLVSVLLAYLFLNPGSIERAEATSPTVAASLLPIFIGGCLSSASDNSFSFIGLVFVSVSNLSFAMRSLIIKQIKETSRAASPKTVHEKPIPALSAFELFLIISKLGAVFLLFLLSTSFIIFKDFNFGLSSRSSNGIEDLLNVEDLLVFVELVGTNVGAYFLYNQMSFFVLSRVSMVTHAVANALRRIVTIIASVWYFRNRVTSVNATGIALAISGVLLYSVAKSRLSRSVAFQRASFRSFRKRNGSESESDLEAEKKRESSRV